MDGKIVIGTEIDTKGFDKEIAVLEDKLNEIKADLYMADQDKTLFSTREIKNMEAEAQKLGRRIDALKEKQSKINNTGFINMKQSVENVGKSVEKVTKKIGKWALAIFGVRSAYMAVVRATNIIASNDEQLQADLDYMKTALAYTLEPVVRAIVDLMKQLLIYVGQIVYAWTGRNIFENANKSLKKANQQATKLSKTLAGFDEMNILQDTSSSGGGGSTVTPSFDLSKLEGETPQWFKDIIDNKDVILATLGGVITALTLVKLGVNGIKALGIGLIIAGVIELVISLIDYFKKLDSSLKNNGTTWEDFGGILTGISLIILGIGVITGGLPIIIAGAVGLIVGIVMKNWEKIKGILVTAKKFIYDVLKWIQDNFGLLGKVIFGIVDSIVNFVVDHFKGMFLPIKNVFDGILLLFKGDFQNGMKNIGKGIANHFVGVINKLIDGINATVSPLRALIVALGQVMGRNFTMQNIRIPRIPYLAKGGIVNMPSRGVPVGNALAGERGAEGVIPLTDSQQMMLLGEAIGKYITINANITNTMNGRVISRELQKINSENDFAYNR